LGPSESSRFSVILDISPQIYFYCFGYDISEWRSIARDTRHPDKGLAAEMFGYDAEMFGSSRTSTYLRNYIEKP